MTLFMYVGAEKTQILSMYAHIYYSSKSKQIISGRHFVSNKMCVYIFIERN